MHLFGLLNGPLWLSLALSYPLALSCSLALFLSISGPRWLSLTFLLSGSLSGLLWLSVAAAVLQYFILHWTQDAPFVLRHLLPAAEGLAGGDLAGWLVSVERQV